MASTLDVPAEDRAHLRAEITDAVSRYRLREPNHQRTQAPDGPLPQAGDRSTPTSRRLWDRISKRTKYRVSLSTDDLVGASCSAIANADPIEPPKVRVRVVELEHSAPGSRADKHIDQHEYDTAAPTVLPDILADLQNETDLTRATLVRILRESGRLADFAVNPQAFTVMVTSRRSTA